jgi:hypothetical protein
VFYILWARVLAASLVRGDWGVSFVNVGESSSREFFDAKNSSKSDSKNSITSTNNTNAEGDDPSGFSILPATTLKAASLCPLTSLSKDVSEMLHTFHPKTIFWCTIEHVKILIQGIEQVCAQMVGRNITGHYRVIIEIYALKMIR